MANKKGLEFSIHTILFPILFVLTMWVVFWIEVRFNLNLNFLGVYPQQVEGLTGLLFAPFVHSSLQHLFNNSVPLLVLMTSVFYFYGHVKWRVLIFGIVLTGAVTWLIGRPAYHIGASGVVYMLAAFLFFKGIISRQFQLIAVSLVVVFLYGSLLWYIFPIDEKISWEGHLAGAIVGIIFAFLFRKNIVEKKKYDWEREDFNPDEDPFIRQFDENGNFIEPTKPINLEEEVSIENSKSKKIKILYTFKKKDENS